MTWPALGLAILGLLLGWFGHERNGRPDKTDAERVLYPRLITAGFALALLAASVSIAASAAECAR